MLKISYVDTVSNKEVLENAYRATFQDVHVEKGTGIYRVSHKFVYRFQIAVIRLVKVACS